MRKIFAMVFVVAMVMSLVACGGGSSSASAPAETKAQETVAVTETVVETETPETVVETEAIETEVVTTELAEESKVEIEIPQYTNEWTEDMYLEYYDGNDFYKVVMEEGALVFMDESNVYHYEFPSDQKATIDELMNTVFINWLDEPLKNEAPDDNTQEQLTYYDGTNKYQIKNVDGFVRLCRIDNDGEILESVIMTKKVFHNYVELLAVAFVVPIDLLGL